MLFVKKQLLYVHIAPYNKERRGVIAKADKAMCLGNLLKKYLSYLQKYSFLFWNPFFCCFLNRTTHFTSIFAPDNRDCMDVILGSYGSLVEKIFGRPD